jgi:transposase-like protein
MTFPAQQVENAPPAKKSYSGIANMLVKRKISIGNQTVNAWSGQLGT